MANNAYDYFLFCCMPISFSVPIIYWKIELNFVLLSMTDACTEKNGMKFEFPKKIYQLYHFLDET